MTWSRCAPKPIRVRPHSLVWERIAKGVYAGHVDRTSFFRGHQRFKAKREGRGQWVLRDRAVKRKPRGTKLRTYQECRTEASKRLYEEAEKRARREALEKGIGEVGSDYVRGLEERIEELERRAASLEDG